METKKFNRKFFLRGLCGGICLVLLVSVALVVYTIASGYWSIAGVALLVLASALVIMIDIFDRDSDITVDYVKRVVRSNIKFDKNKTIVVPFESIVSVYIYNADQLKREIKLKKYPVKTLVIEKAHNKEYISLKFFDEKTICDLIRELQKARESV